MPKSDNEYMALAIAGAKNGEGAVEPNPMVGCLIVAGDDIIGMGWHQKFGEAHAEVNAINSVKPEDICRIEGSTLFVTLEPCSHHGKTGPCCDALIKARVGRVVVAVADPNPKVAGQGIERMNAAGISVEVGVLADQANEVLAPYLKRTQANVPWVLAKWAMTVDGKIASASGSSKWISSERSRERVHQLRRRCDAVVVGIGTALADDPMLNPRPAGERSVLRVVVDSKARIAIDSKLVATATDYRTLIAVGPEASQIKIDDLERLNCEVWQCTLPDANERLSQLLQYLAKNDCTNILVEGGGRLLGALNDLEQIDEAHVFVGPKLLGGGDAISPVAGIGQSAMTAASGLSLQNVQRIDNDIYAIYRKKRVQTIAQG